MTDALAYLDEAADIMRERGKAYDQPTGERSIGKAVAAFNALTGHKLSVADGWHFMLLLKLARQSQTTDFHRDSALDIVAYAALAAEAGDNG